ncbi:polyketide synthase dehydratase domain-containing protein [Streptomyces sp. GLT-R25]
MHTRGIPVTWPTLFEGRPTHLIDLPTYPFQHKHYWMHATQDTVDVQQAGLESAEHPLLGAVVELPGSGDVVLSGRLSIERQPWLADHTVMGTILFPGTGFVELAIRAGDEVNCPVLDELTLHNPLPLPEHGGIAVQVMAAAPDQNGHRHLRIHTRPENTTPDEKWTLHAEGTLTPDTTPTNTPTDMEIWPPERAVVVSLEGFYERLAGLGLAYGPVFQGVRALWQRGDEVFAEVELPAQAIEQATGFGLHPALFDAALHALAGTGEDDGRRRRRAGAGRASAVRLAGREAARFGSHRTARPPPPHRTNLHRHPPRRHARNPRRHGHLPHHPPRPPNDQPHQPHRPPSPLPPRLDTHPGPKRP